MKMRLGHTVEPQSCLLPAQRGGWGGEGGGWGGSEGDGGWGRVGGVGVGGWGREGVGVGDGV